MQPKIDQTEYEKIIDFSTKRRQKRKNGRIAIADSEEINDYGFGKPKEKAKRKRGKKWDDVMQDIDENILLQQASDILQNLNQPVFDPDDAIFETKSSKNWKSSLNPDLKNPKTMLIVIVTLLTRCLTCS